MNYVAWWWVTKKKSATNKNMERRRKHKIKHVPKKEYKKVRTEW